MSAVLGTVASLLRFPVKSLRGERLEATEVGPAGLEGDRSWALLDDEGNWASAKANRGRWRLVEGMLDLAATTDDDGVRIHLPDGRRVRTDDPDAADVLSAHLGRPLRLDEGDGGRRWGRHHDAAPVHLVTTATLAALAADEDGRPEERAALDPVRLRPNLVVSTPPGVEGFAEDSWAGRVLRVGGAVLEVQGPTGRCVMTTRAQGSEVPLDGSVLRRIGRRNGADAGVYLTVREPGRIAVGDELRAVDA